MHRPPVAPPPPQVLRSPARPTVVTEVLSHQSIVDAHGALLGYELLQRGRPVCLEDDRAEVTFGDVAKLLGALRELPGDAPFGNRLVFIHCPHDALVEAAHFTRAGTDRMVLEVPAVPGASVGSIATIGEAVWQAKEQGFLIALGGYALAPAYATWLPAASYLKLDTVHYTLESIARLIGLARAQSRAAIIAEGVSSRATLLRLAEMGAHYFQGFQFDQPVAAATRIVNPAYANVIELVNMTRRGADVGEIEALLKRAPMLSFKLLRYVNSAAFGLQCEINSFHHAVMLLGMKKLSRWAALLLTSVQSAAAPRVVSHCAVTRARFMELVAVDCLSPEYADNAFLTGIFSTLDVMLGVPMAQALDTVSLPSDVTDALLGAGGLLAPFLQLAVACEGSDGDTLDLLASAVPVTAQRINCHHLEALSWAEQLRS